ncbi:hypothetical protein HF086_013518 [Spodoptera exigua]|uniref:LIM zinc-binding domain-containing protein n=1 Tax=Spodoptera exigua TaxID=7107 RepID=A0A922SBA7_SPOEX|nr:hypothetical protein HF086_013518 [Spodoptera exigua]
MQIVTALNKKWHPEHFTCNTCRKPIDGAKFHQHDGGVHCVPCFATHHSPRCHGCGEPITDKCRNPVTDATFSVMDNKPLCGKCA